MDQISSHEDVSKASQQQLALSLFQSMDAGGVSIVDAGQDFHFKKSSILVDVSDIGLLARRVLNGFYFLAQADPEIETHSYDLRYFKWLVNFENSNNIAHLKRVVREAQKCAVQVNVIDEANPSQENWMSVPMLGATAISGGKVMFKIPAELRRQLKDPQRHAFLSMRILAGFSRIYALELYERLCVFKQEGRTPWWEIDAFRELIKVDDLKSANEFRYFKRDIIDVAVNQINKVSDIEVEVELRRTGRSYSHIAFTVKESQRINLLLSVEESKKLYETLVSDFGLSDAELDEIAENRLAWTDARILDAVAFVKHRCATSTVKYPGKYLMNALRGGYRVGAIEKDLTVKEQKKAEVKEATQSRLFELQNKSPVGDTALPDGNELIEAWNLFCMSPSARLFKALPSEYELATPRQKKAFEGFWALQGKSTSL